MSINSLRSALYALARLLGDIKALLGGPKAMGKRWLRKKVHKKAGKAINRILK